MKRFVQFPALAVILIAAAGCQQEQQTSKLTPSSEIDKQAYSVGTAIGNSVKRNIDQVISVEENFSVDMFLQGLHDAIKGEQQFSEEELTKISTEFQQHFFEKHQAKQDQEGKANAEAGKAFLAENAKKEGVKQTDSGLQYKVLTESTGPKPSASDTVKVNYKGTLIDGTEFDSSYKRGQPAEFPLSGVITGWTEGLQLMPVGSKYEFYIPAEMAYGENSPPSIPANSTLIFEVELLEIVSAE